MVRTYKAVMKKRKDPDLGKGRDGNSDDVHQLLHGWHYARKRPGKSSLAWARPGDF
jgi:hypothetical protein